MSMEKYNFEWIGKRAYLKKDPQIRINHSYIAFNSASIELMKNPSYILVGLDIAKNVIGIRQYDDKDHKAGKPFPFAIKPVNNGWRKVHAKTLISQLHNYKLGRYKLNEYENVYVAEIEECLQAESTTRGKRLNASGKSVSD